MTVSPYLPKSPSPVGPPKSHPRLSFFPSLSCASLNFSSESSYPPQSHRNHRPKQNRQTCKLERFVSADRTSDFFFFFFFFSFLLPSKSIVSLTLVYLWGGERKWHTCLFLLGFGGADCCRIETWPRIEDFCKRRMTGGC